MNPVKDNPLRTRADVERAAVQLIEPLVALFSPGKARLHLGDTGAVYPADIAQMEAYSRPLWALVPMMAGGCKAAEPLFAIWREGLLHGTDPSHAEYWGDIGPFDQRMVEMAVMGMALCLIPETFFFSFPKPVQDNIHAWLMQINQHEMPGNNWVFFRVLVNIGFMKNGLPYDVNRLETDLALIETHYEGDGWYFDYPDQREYYTFWAFHYYGLLYAHVMQDHDAERCHLYRERAKKLAPRFALWFDEKGHALPYGRSLSYRFAESAFFAMLALDEQQTDEVPYGVMKHILLGNMREWFQKPIFTRDGVLTIGYGYPNLIMSEGYNAPGSPYWAMKAFAVLALPEDHPFWQAEERPFENAPAQFLEPHARLLLTRAKDGSHVQAFAAGNHGEGHAHDEAKYEKFCYSTAFAFSVPKSTSRLMQGAFDNMLAFSETGFMWHARYGVRRYELLPDRVQFVWEPFRGVTVDTTLYPVGEWHIRVHRIQSDRALIAAEGGYAIAREMDGCGIHSEADDMHALAQGAWGISGIRAIQGYTRGEVIMPEPNTNLLHNRTALPTLHANIACGETVLVCAVLGAVTNGASKWVDAPKEDDYHAAMGE